MAKEKLNKVIKGLKKASKTHAQQAKTLSTIKMKEGGSASSGVPKNVSNPKLYKKVKAEMSGHLPTAADGWLKRTKIEAANTQLR